MIKINVITNNNEWNLFLKNPNSYIDRKINFDVVNPSSDKNIEPVMSKLSNYHGLIWGGSSLNI